MDMEPGTHCPGDYSRDRIRTMGVMPHVLPRRRKQPESRTLQEWITWKSDSAGEVATYAKEANVERWHRRARKTYWNWAGHAVRMDNLSMNKLSATLDTKSRRRGRPPPHGRSFSKQLARRSFLQTLTSGKNLQHTEHNGELLNRYLRTSLRSTY